MAQDENHNEYAFCIEARRLLELFLGMTIEDFSIYSNESHNDHLNQWYESFKKAKENALKCCEEKIRSIIVYSEQLLIRQHSTCNIVKERYNYYEGVKKVIKNFEI